MLVNRCEDEIYQSIGKRIRLLVVPEIELSPEQDAPALLRVICSALKQDTADCFVKSRLAKYQHLRMLACYFIRQYFPSVGYKSIGELVGSIDHTTVIYYCKRVPELTDVRHVDFMPKYDVVLDAVTQWIAAGEDKKEVSDGE